MSFEIPIHLLIVAQSQSANLSPSSPLILFTASIAWAALWIQFVVLPFYNKGETLHKDYWASGRMNLVIAGIEADRLIPALARMFTRAIEAQEDKRKRPENEIHALLQSVEFLPELKEAQESMSSMDELENRYKQLKVIAGRLWKWGFAHVILTPVLPAIYIFLLPIDHRWTWALVALCGAWSIALGFSIFGALKFHSHLGRFTTALESKVGT